MAGYETRGQAGITSPSLSQSSYLQLQLWTNVYKDNLRLYNGRIHSYKSGNLAAKDMTDSEAAEYIESHNIDEPAETADAQLVGETAAALNEEDEVEAEAEIEPEKEDTPPPPKTPRAKSSRKSKGKTTEAVTTPQATETIIPTPSSASIVPPKAAEKEEKVDKKRKRVSKKGAADEPVATTEKEELAVETPKAAPKPRKKKAKAEA